MPLVGLAWDSPLPFSNSPATTTGQSAFANPAAAAFGSGSEYGLSWAEGNVPGATPERLWTAQYQREGIGTGLRYATGNGPYEARLDLSMATDWRDLVSPGLKLSYVSSGGAPDHGILDFGIDLRPWRQLLIGYWGENLWTGGLEQPTQHFAIAIKPFASFKGWPTDFQLGIATSKQKGLSQRGFLFTQLPIYHGLRMQVQLDGKNKGLFGRSSG